MSTVRDQDIAIFAKLGISPELLERAGVERVTDRQARAGYGIVGSGDMSGIAFPYWNPTALLSGERRRNYVRVRRDHPEIDNGKPKKKYVAPYGDRKHLYFPPTPDLFPEPSIPVILVEAEKSALALTAWCERKGRKMLPIAMGGCWGWRGQVGMQTTANGERVPETGALPDLNICREARITYVLLDANCGSNPKVQAARAALVQQLRKQGAAVRVLDLPSADGVNGPDDYIAFCGDESMGNVIDGWVDGAKILDDVADFIEQYVRLTLAQLYIVAVWSVHTHAMTAARETPYLAIHSAEKQSGKTRLLEVLDLLVNKPWLTGRVTAACLVRKIHQERPTLLLDESDAAFQGEKEYAEALRGILNTGHREDGKASCCVGQGANITVKDFRTFCPKAIAGIGRNLPDTVMDRSIPIYLKRQAPGERVARFRRRDVKPEADELCRQVSDWVTSILGGLREARPLLPASLSDRRQDGLEPLAAIAEAAGGEWPQRIRAAALEVFNSAAADDPSIGVQLLADIRDIFDGCADDDKITSEELITKLKEIESSPWADWEHGKGLSKGKLARLLSKYEISPRVMRVDGKTPRGYLRESFLDAWSRYLPGLAAYTPPQNATAQQPARLQAETDFSETQQKADVALPKSGPEPHKHYLVADVALLNRDQAGAGEQTGVDQPGPNEAATDGGAEEFDRGTMAVVKLRLVRGLPVKPELLAAYKRYRCWKAQQGGVQ